MPEIDKYDCLILEQLQVDATIANAALAERIGLSANACWRRTKALESQGIIRKRVALVSEQAVGLGVTVFVDIRTSQHTDDWLERFGAGVRDIPEVVEFYRLSGDTDYLLKIVVQDISDYDRVYKQLIQVAPLSDVSSSFAMERIKSSTALPLHHLRS